MRPAGALRSEDSKTVPTPATNRARQIGDSLEHLLSGTQQAWWTSISGGTFEFIRGRCVFIYVILSLASPTISLLDVK